MAIATKIIREHLLENNWRVTYTDEDDFDDDEAGPFAVTVDIERSNGGEWEGCISGQIKRDGCCDWGFAQPVMLHFCGRKDADLLAVVMDEAEELFWKDKR